MNVLEQTNPDTIGETVSVPRSALKRRKGLDFWLTSLKGPTYEEFQITLQSFPGEKSAELVRRLACMLTENNATVVRHEIFGPTAMCQEILRSLQHTIPGFDWPVMWIGNNANASDISGMHVFAIAGVPVDTVYKDGVPIGRVFDDAQARHCLLSGLKPANPSASQPAQCKQVFRSLESALSETGMNLADVARTWFFLHDIHSWYGEFNHARIEFFQEKKFFDHSLPASTGIGTYNSANAAIIGGAWAVQPVNGSVLISEVTSPLQCASMEYGSAFSRAVLVDTLSCRRLLISGTASIGPDGHSAHIGDPRRQIVLTMEVVRAILVSRGFDFLDVTRATAYFKDIVDTRIFGDWRTEHNLEFLPLIEVQADICRPELLFEIELDAIQINPGCLHRDSG